MHVRLALISWRGCNVSSVCCAVMTQSLSMVLPREYTGANLETDKRDILVSALGLLPHVETRRRSESAYIHQVNF